MPRNKFSVKSVITRRNGFRAALTLGALFVCWLSIVNTVSAIADQANPDLVLKISPNNSRALALKGDALWTANPDKADDPEIAKLGRAALRDQALNAGALRLIAVSEQAKGNIQSAGRLISLSNKVSRRDTLSQLWLVQEALQRGDAKQALRHYDIALRTNAQAHDYLFPQLVKLLDDGAYSDAFKPYLSTGTPWLPNFLNYTIWKTPYYPALSSAVIVSGGLPGGDGQYRSFETQIINQLISNHHYDLAQNFFLTLKGNDPASLHSIKLSKTSIDPKFAPINWRIDSGAGAGADAAYRNGQFDIQATANATSSGVVAQKLLFLKPGLYSMKQRYNVRSLGKGASATWVMRCMYMEDSKIIWKYQIDGNLNNKDIAIPLQIPVGCLNQFIELSLVGGDEAQGVELSLSHLEIIPVG